MKDMWFKNRKYGWGWFPITIEGWLVTIGAIIGLIYYRENYLIMLIIAIGLVVIGHLKGPKPEWRWG